MLDEKVSVIIPMYNSSKHIEECIQSILNQTYENIELQENKKNEYKNKIIIFNV